MSQGKLLVVDDEQVTRNVFRTLLEDAGFQVVEAESYDQAIDLMDSSIDIALLDVVLKEKSGLDVLKYIRYHFPSCPAIMISGHANKTNAIAALHEGAAEYLEKPVDAQRLVHTIKHWASYHAMQQENVRLQDHKAMYEALQEKEARFANILDSAMEAIVSADKNQNIILFNNGAETIFGYRQEEVLGKHVEMLLPERFREAHRQDVKLFIKEENALDRYRKPHRKIFGLKKNGEEIALEGSISRVSSGGKIIVTAVLQDITERKQAEAEVQEHIQKLERFNKMAVGRELQMIELKKEINAQLAELGREAKYTIHDPAGAGDE